MNEHTARLIDRLTREELQAKRRALVEAIENGRENADAARFGVMKINNELRSRADAPLSLA